MNKCPRCGSILVAHETAQAVNGKIYCSRHCAVLDIADSLHSGTMSANSHNEAVEAAKEYFDECSETVLTEDVLAEDLQEVQIAVTYFKTIKLPKCMSEAKAKEVAEKLWNDDLVLAEPDECDDVRIECELVKRRNSSCEEV